MVYYWHMTIRQGIYEHYKEHDRYRVFGVAYHSETHDAFVVYQAQYGGRQLWIRPYDMFIQWVWHEGDTVPRFKYLGPT